MIWNDQSIHVELDWIGLDWIGLENVCKRAFFLLDDGWVGEGMRRGCRSRKGREEKKRKEKKSSLRMV